MHLERRGQRVSPAVELAGEHAPVVGVLETGLLPDDGETAVGGDCHAVQLLDERLRPHETELARGGSAGGGEETRVDRGGLDSRGPCHDEAAIRKDRGHGDGWRPRDGNADFGTRGTRETEESAGEEQEEEKQAEEDDAARLLSDASGLRWRLSALQSK